MFDPQDDDNDLLRRLNALRQSSVQFSGGPAPPGTTGLASRFQSLRGAGSNIPQSLSLEDERDILETHFSAENDEFEQVLRELSQDTSQDIGRSEEEDIKRLLDTAQQALDATKGDLEGPNNSMTANANQDDIGLDSRSNCPEETQETEESKETEEDEASKVIERALDEAKLSPQETLGEEGTDSGEDPESLVNPFELPAAPTDLPPLDDEEPEGQDSDLAARFASLSLPSAPTFKPGDAAKRKKAAQPSDEEVDGWCIICMDDGAVRCLGCDKDVYCRKCWFEGHQGEDALFENKSHKWVKFQKPSP